MKILFTLTAISLLFLMISGCTASPNEMVNSPDEEGHIAGF
jgi:hypothetical protein